jgi:hypothetical protein
VRKELLAEHIGSEVGYARSLGAVPCGKPGTAFLSNQNGTSPTI